MNTRTCVAIVCLASALGCGTSPPRRAPRTSKRAPKRTKQRPVAAPASQPVAPKKPAPGPAPEAEPAAAAAAAAAAPLADVAAAPGWEIALEGSGLPRITYKGTPVVSGGYAFWGAKWKYAGARVRPARGEGAAKRFAGEVRNLGLRLEAAATNEPDNVVAYRWTVNASKGLSGIIGGGIEFKVAHGAPVVGGDAGEPEIVADNGGWRWPVGGGRAVEVRFEPAIASVYFERGDKGRIRCMFVPTDVAPGTTSFTMKVILPEGGRMVASLEDRYGPVERETWRTNLFDWSTSPVDLSFLNHKPAGGKGPVSVSGDGLVFADGTPARFWGANIQAYALFNTDDRNIPAQARRIARLGYNLIRIHHHDSTWVNPNVFGERRSTDSTRKLAPASMRKLDRWIDALKREGVYVWLDLHVGRDLYPSDGAEHFKELAKKSGGNNKGKRAGVKGYCYLNESIAKLMREFTGQYLTHVNEFTGVAYKDEPAVMGVLITNENDVTHHFGNGYLPDKGVPEHNRMFNADRKAFCDRTGLSFDATFKTWEPGESKIYLNDMEHRFNVKMIAQLKELGVRAPFATTQLWGGMPAFSLPALTDSTIIDTHSYNRSEELSRNPRFNALSMANTALGSVYGKPVAITEWNIEPFPGRDRFYAPVAWAAFAALQGWDAPMLYGYSQTPLNGSSRGNNWSAYNDPAMVGMNPVAALLYRRADVSRAKKTYCVKFDRQSLFFKSVSIGGNLCPAIRTLFEQSRVTIGLPAVEELPWLKETEPGDDVEVVTDLERDFIPAGRTYVESDTGEVRRYWLKGIQTVDTARTQLAHGWIGGEPIDLADVKVNVTTSKALVAVQSLSDEPVANAPRILITVCARVVPENGNRTPFHSEPVVGKVTIRAAAGKTLKALGPDGSATDAPGATYANGRYTITLDDAMRSHWYVLE